MRKNPYITNALKTAHGRLVGGDDLVAAVNWSGQWPKKKGHWSATIHRYITFADQFIIRDNARFGMAFHYGAVLVSFSV